MTDESNQLNNPELFPVYSPEPFTVESPFLTLEYVLEAVYQKVKYGRLPSPTEDDEELEVETDTEKRATGGLFMGMSGISITLNELFWQVGARFKAQKEKEKSSDDFRTEQGIKAKQYIIGAILHAGITPMQVLLNQTEKITEQRIEALNSGNNSFLATFRTSKLPALLSHYSEKMTKTIRIGFLSGLDKHRWMDIHESYNWNANEVANLLMIYGIACSTTILPWDTCVKLAREQIIDFRTWYKKNY
jgi:hypothetical protein